MNRSRRVLAEMSVLTTYVCNNCELLLDQHNMDGLVCSGCGETSLTELVDGGSVTFLEDQELDQQ